MRQKTKERIINLIFCIVLLLIGISMMSYRPEKADILIHRETNIVFREKIRDREVLIPTNRYITSFVIKEFPVYYTKMDIVTNTVYITNYINSTNCITTNVSEHDDFIMYFNSWHRIEQPPTSVVK